MVKHGAVRQEGLTKPIQVSRKECPTFRWAPREGNSHDCFGAVQSGVELPNNTIDRSILGTAFPEWPFDRCGYSSFCPPIRLEAKLMRVKARAKRSFSG